ncbi:hypothetical protein E2562_025605 [Oryza meyeriana var. granulata]|uniref:Uncharacterized protein n=1 Tax=Oryza meyeriana var. granulata TaxID=110450 RepID=A0A6G1E288_9ORYZ|nr:hypothetical protein E2562_025605 [Oryza meyeriana var. granulata]
MAREWARVGCGGPRVSVMIGRASREWGPGGGLLGVGGGPRGHGPVQQRPTVHGPGVGRERRQRVEWGLGVRGAGIHRPRSAVDQGGTGPPDDESGKGIGSACARL